MHGFLILDKPMGLSSARTLAPIKRTAGRRVKVGHAGTLDPFATGVLLALLGNATRLAGIAQAIPKTYVAAVRFGWETDTLDWEGEMVAEADPGPVPPAGLERAVQAFVGEIEQVPPAFSALRVNGRRAYRLARAGKRADLEPRRVTIHDIRLLDTNWPEATLEITCGAGTYVRALARDLGRRIDLPASLTVLRRSRVGPFAVEDAAPRDVASSTQRLRAHLRPPLQITRAGGLPEIRLDPDGARSFCLGGVAPVPVGSTPATASRVAVLHGDTRRLLGLGTLLPDGTVQPNRVLTP